MKNGYLQPLTLCFLIFPFCASSQQTTAIYKRDTLITNNLSIDNDFFLGIFGLSRLNFDRDYTMGLSYMHGRNYVTCPAMYQPLHWFNKLLRKQDLIQDSLYHSWQVMNGSFTPADLRPAAIIENDRPYAALTVLETTISRFDMESGRRRTAKLALGIIGTRISETIQTFLHNLLNHGDTMRPHTPKGWPNQISDKGEPTLLYSFQDEWILGKRPFEEERKGLVQAKMGYKYSVGYFTSVGGVFEIRVGKIDHHNWFNDANHLVDVNKYTSIAYKTAPGLRKEKSFREAYVFLSLMPNIVLYNALLNGQFERSPHTANFSETKHFVMEGDTGAGVTFYNRRNFRVHNFILRLSAQTPEYEFAGTAPRWHYWGGLEFNWWKIKR